MMVGGWTCASRSINRGEQPARGGSRMTVVSGVMCSKTSSDLARMGRAVEGLFLTNSR